MPAAAGRRDDLTILDGRRVRFGHIQRNKLLLFVDRKQLRLFPIHFFTVGAVTVSSIFKSGFYALPPDA